MHSIILATCDGHARIVVVGCLRKNSPSGAYGSNGHVWPKLGQLQCPLMTKCGQRSGGARNSRPQTEEGPHQGTYRLWAHKWVRQDAGRCSRGCAQVVSLGARVPNELHVVPSCVSGVV